MLLSASLCRHFHFSGVKIHRHGLAGVAVYHGISDKRFFQVVGPFYSHQCFMTVSLLILMNTWSCQCLVSAIWWAHSGISLWFHFAFPWWWTMSILHAYSSIFVKCPNIFPTFFQLGCLFYMVLFGLLVFLSLSCSSSNILDINTCQIYVVTILPEYILSVDWYSFSSRLTGLRCPEKHSTTPVSWI